MSRREWPSNPPPMSYASLLTRPNGHDTPTTSDEYRRRWSAHPRLVAACVRAANVLAVLSREPGQNPALELTATLNAMNVAIAEEVRGGVK